MVSVMLRLEITPKPAPDDPPYRGREYQMELRALIEAIQSKGFKVGVTLEGLDAATGSGEDLATYTALAVQLVKSGGPLIGVIGIALGAWITGRNGRKVRLKIGDIEAEARTEKEVLSLLEKAQEIQRKNEPRKIHEV